MRRVLILCVVSFLLINMILSVPVSMASDNIEYVKVHIDGQETEVKKINVTINGQDLESDVPPILYQTRTLVPIRFIAENLDAEIEWKQETKEAIIKALGKEIILKIDSSEVRINGEKKELPYGVPAKLVNDGRTMVPIRFVSEELGCNVEWDSETWTAIINLKEQEIFDISIDETTHIPRIEVNTSGPVLYDVIELEESNKLVLDIPHTVLNIQDEDKLDDRGILNIEGNKYPLIDVRSSQFEVDPNITRIVIDLEEMTEYKITNFQDGKGFEVSFTNEISEIKMEEIDGKEAIVIYNSKETKYSSFMLENPKRIVVDLMSSKYEGDKYVYEIENDILEKARIAQFEHNGQYPENEKVVRVVLDIKEENYMPHLSTQIKDNNLIIFLEEQDFSSINYEPIEEKLSILTLKTTESPECKIDYNEKSKIMVITMEKDKIEASEGTIVIDDKLVDSIVIKEGVEKKVFYIKLKEEILYIVNENKVDNKISISIGGVSNKFKDKLIVIDAGHGGKDPGTRAINSKIKEKTLNLLVANRLSEKLNEIGFQTVLTRSTDEYIGLYERADIANATDGDAFISIHFNAHNDSDISGIETIYCPSYESEVKTENNYPFAEIIHNALLDELDRTDRGIDKRPEIVVTRETKMVAALVELGFLSNEEEEALIMETDYIDRAIEAIANGLIEYFEE